MQITEKKQDKEIILEVEGRVDTNTSTELQQAILKAFQKRPNLVLDFQGVDYVSSAGLRAILIGQKTANAKDGSLKLVHICERVQHVLELSGFSTILTIE